MARSPGTSHALPFGVAAATRRTAIHGTALTLVLLATGCAVGTQNRQAAQEIAEQTRPTGSIYMGWRVFQDKCASCHGTAATGATGGPDLLPRVSEMGPRRFVGLVLRRYDWSLPAAEAGRENAAREALIDEMLQRKAGTLTMPAWQGEPRVSAHIADLYAYLSARAQGVQGPGRPMRE